MKFLIACDLDGVVVDNSRREALAECAKQDYLKEMGGLENADKKDIDSVYYQSLLNGLHMYLDQIIPDAFESLRTLEEMGHHIIYTTSRPEHLRVTTARWLLSYGLWKPETRELQMKPARCQFIKTVEWKPAMIKELAMNQHEHGVLLIDDSDDICTAFQAYQSEVDFKIMTSTDLTTAVQMMQGI